MADIDKILAKEHHWRRHSFDYELENALATALGLHRFSSGGQTIRDERGWRQNEKYVEYAWLAVIDFAFRGKGGVFAMKLNESDFREHKNPEQLVRGAFRLEANDKISALFVEHERNNFHDSIHTERTWDLFEANRGITLDGVGYRFYIHSASIDTVIRTNNPNSAPWKKWESEIYHQGRRLSGLSGTTSLIGFFSPRVSD